MTETAQTGMLNRPGQPAVSVIIPAFNAARYIGEALDSVFAQTFWDFEVIVVNDGSDDTEELERLIEPNRERIVYLRQDNAGPSGARNTGIQKAQGEYLAFLDSDDIWMPEYLSQQVSILRNDDSLAVVCADAHLFGDSPLAGRTFMEVWPSREPVTFEKLISFQCAILTMCVVVSKQAVVRAGLFDTRFLRSEDHDLWLRLALNSERFAYQHRVLAYHRLHSESLAANYESLHLSQIEVYRKLLGEWDLTMERRQLTEQQIIRCQAALALQQGKLQIISGQYPQAAEALRSANGYYRSNKLKLALLSLRCAPGLLRRVFQLYQRLAARGMNPAV